MCAKNRILLISLLFCVSSVFSAGNKQIESKTLSQTESWLEEYDISDKKSGKYNIFVTVDDKGGNTQYAGPYNIYIDSDSDLPVAMISNPFNEMQVNGDLNIVGTCVDDDAVKAVELVFDGDEENAVKADGLNFWSYFLKTENLLEGPHTIDVYGIDVNGVKGKSERVTWNLDRRVPVTQIENFAMGQTICKNVNLSGTVTDGNGIKKLEYSIDGGKSFKECKISEQKLKQPLENGLQSLWRFNIPLDTKKLSDGPNVIWMKAFDKLDSVGVYSFLYFVDNTAPDVKIVYPEENSVNKGIFTVAGHAKDALGISRLCWTFGKEKGEFDVVPGNPYWVKEFNTIGMTEKYVDFVIDAYDDLGNVTSVSRRIFLNQELDKPLVVIESPVNESSVDFNDVHDLYLRGIASDDDGISSIEYKIDDNDFSSFESTGAFFCPFFSDLKAGEHTITVVATDKNGVKSNAVQSHFYVREDYPLISDCSLPDGSVINSEENVSVKSLIESSDGLKKVSYSFICNGKTVVSHNADVRIGQKKFSLDIPFSESPWGVVEVDITAENIYDKAFTRRHVFFVKDLTLAQSSTSDIEKIEAEEETAESDIKINFTSVCGKNYEKGIAVPLEFKSAKNDENVVVAQIECYEELSEVSCFVNDETVKGVYKKVSDGFYEVNIPLYNLPSQLAKINCIAKSKNDEFCSAFAYVNIVREKDKDLIDNEKKVYAFNEKSVLSLSDVVLFYANIDKVEKVSLKNDCSGLDLFADGKIIKLVAERDGVYDDVIVVATDENGNEHESSAISFTVNNKGPSVKIVKPFSQSWTGEKIELSGIVYDALDIEKVEYSIDGKKSWKEASFENADGRTSYSAVVDLSLVDDGLVCIDVRATNAVGLVGYTASAFQKDVTPPVYRVILPEAGDVINGENTVAFLVKDNGLLVKSCYEDFSFSTSSMPFMNVGNDLHALKKDMKFSFYDAAGNVCVCENYDFVIDSESDLPVAEIHLPLNDAVITNDFVISGVIYDDDGASELWYKIDDGEYKKAVDADYKFSVNVPLNSLCDNEHVISVYAKDMYGNKGAVVEKSFKVSLEEPFASLTSPFIWNTVRDYVTLQGNAFDENGISLVQVSLDNGNTYNEVVAEYGHDKKEVDWSYVFNTNVIPDGTHVVFIKVRDWYGVEAIYSSMLSTDNTCPKLDLQLPLDGSKTSGMVFLSGQTTDNIALDSLCVNISSLDGNDVSESMKKITLIPYSIIAQSIDLSSLDSGIYNIELVGKDAAGNVTRLSRNIELDKQSPVAQVSILYPMNGQDLQGVFNIYGSVNSENPVNKLELLVDGVPMDLTEATESSYFKFTLGNEEKLLSDGNHEIQVVAITDDARIVSEKEYIFYKKEGAWVTIDSLTYGDFAFDRPFLSGTSGYSYNTDSLEHGNKAENNVILKQIADSKTISHVDLSFDNGRSFTTVSNGANWKYRIENEDIAEGYHFILVRAVAKNGETAVTRIIVQIDKTKPSVRLISPCEGGRYNGSIDVSGLASDDISLKNVKFTLRKGDKAFYEVPSFIQGLYLDFNAGGATLYNVGLGLSFFDDNVKLQAQWGQFTQAQRNMFSKTSMRYGGDNIFGLKILANIGYLPFRALLGPDWNWLSGSLAVGANFTRFNETGSGKEQILSALIAQVEFPRFTAAKRTMFKTFSLYAEPQLWFIPTDVTSSGTKSINNLVFQLSAGARIYVF